MNTFKNMRKCTLYISFICIAGLFGCSKSFLNEQNPGGQTADTYYTNSVGFNSLVYSCYPLLRDMEQVDFTHILLNGTDIFTNSSIGALYFNQPNPVGTLWDTYNKNQLNSSEGTIKTTWDLYYREINRCNAVISRASAVTDMTDAVKAEKVAEAKFLRSFVYFRAVQLWGDIPMPLTESTSASLAVTKTPAKDVYTQIIKDLTECSSVLPATQSGAGLPTQGAAEFLLARVYLTRGWNFNNSLGGTPADFTSALQLCDQIISPGQYPLEKNWNDLWPLHNINPTKETASAASSVAHANASKEVIFAIQYSNPASYQGDPSVGNTTVGNDMHMIFGGGPSDGNVARTSAYNRHLGGNNCTWAAYRMFDPDLDTRYAGTFNSITYQTTPGAGYGDTLAIFMPWNHPAVKAGLNFDTTSYYIGNTTDYFGLGYDNSGQPIYANKSWQGGKIRVWYGGPMFWKFFQPGILYDDGSSTFNDPLFRSAEVYLMAAEAIVKGATGGKLGTADVYYNIVLDRALGPNAGKSPMRAANPENPNDPITNVVSYRATPDNINIDMILNERARELMGEGGERWFDLKRTNTLISRGEKYNPWIAHGTSGTPLIDANCLLRPIPQAEIDASVPHISQNPGY